MRLVVLWSEFCNDCCYPIIGVCVCVRACVCVYVLILRFSDTTRLLISQSCLPNSGRDFRKKKSLTNIQIFLENPYMILVRIFT